MRRRSRCLIVGVLNCTPDSFSDGGRFASVKEAVEAGVRMAGEGADWIDVGGESTRPGAETVSGEDERARVVPVIEGLRARLRDDVLISIDTYKAETARAALAAGARVVNDVTGALIDPAILEVAAEAGAKLVLGHLRGRPSTMMDDVAFGDVVAEVGDELAGASRRRARAPGAARCGPIPASASASALEHNLALLRDLPALRARLGVPLMVGVSRKAFIGELTGKPPAERVFGTAAAVTAAVFGRRRGRARPRRGRPCGRRSWSRRRP